MCRAGTTSLILVVLSPNEQGLLHVAVFENMLLGTKAKLKNKT